MTRGRRPRGSLRHHHVIVANAASADTRLTAAFHHGRTNSIRTIDVPAGGVSRIR